MRSSKGIATLPVVLLISSIVIELTIAGVVLSAFLSNTVLSSKLSSEALAAARTGAQDAIMKIIRNKDFVTPLEGYSLLNISDRTSAQIIVCKDSKTVVTSCDTSIPPIPPAISAGLDEITSIGTALTRKKKIQAVVGVDPNSGGISILSFKEVPL